MVGVWASDVDVIVLAGGAARRLGGIDKAAVSVGEMTLLDRVLATVEGARRVIVVGPRRALTGPRPVASRSVVWCQETPSGGGPVAGLSAGLAVTSAPVVLVLAVDMPWIAGAIAPLLGALSADVEGRAVAVLVDSSGRVNYLAAAWRRVGLERALADLSGAVGRSMRSLYAAVDAIEVADRGHWGADVDTPADLERAQRDVRLSGRERN